MAEKEKKRKFWRDLWKLIDFSKKQIKTLLFLTVVFELIRLASPYFLKMVIDRLANFDVEEIRTIILLVALMFASSQIDSLISYFKDKQIFKILIGIEYHLPIMAQKKLIFLPLNYHEKENTGGKISKIERGVIKIVELIGNMSWEVVPTIIQLVLTLTVLFIVDFRFGLSFAVFAPFFIFITYRSNIHLYPIRKKRHQDYELASAKMGQGIMNINTVQSFVQEKREVREFRLIREDIRANETKEWFYLLNSGLSRNLIIDLGRIVIMLLGVFLVWQGEVTIGTLIFVITLSEKAYFSLWRLSRFYDRMEEGAEAVNRFIGLIDEKQDIINPPKGVKPTTLCGKIEFKNVNFTYKDSKNKAISNASFKINAGCVTALVGPSGGGKTTVARRI